MPQLLERQRRLSQKSANLGVTQDRRRYRPHLTLGRMPPPLPQQKRLETLVAEHREELRIDRICLYSSHMQPEGAEHKRLAEFRFIDSYKENNR